MSGRYTRHQSLIGDAGWQQLPALCLLVAGVGGLGSHVTSLLARLGPLSLELWDPGVLDEPDLNRQVLYTDKDLGERKVDCAVRRLAAANPELTIRTVAEPIRAERFAELRSDNAALVIFDCLDSFQARAELDRIAAEWDAWVFHGGVEGWYGQATSIRPGTGGYAARFGEDYAGRAAAGKPILPSVVAAVAAMQVGDFVRWLARGEAALDGRIAVYDGDQQLVEHIELALEEGSAP